MIKSPFKNRSRDRRPARPQLGQRGPRDLPPRREGSSRRENATVVHPWMSLPEKLALAQVAMHELAGNAAFQCPLGETYRPVVSAKPAEDKPRPTGVNIVFRKRRLPANAVNTLVPAN
jgi:hypothetical protein